MDTIFIHHLEVETIIGVYKHERTTKQPIIIDLEIQYDTTQARFSDELRYTLDYHQLTLDLHEFIRNSSFKLIESLAHAIADRILKNQKIKKLALTLSKPQALEQARNVGIKICRSN